MFLRLWGWNVESTVENDIPIVPVLRARRVATRDLRQQKGARMSCVVSILGQGPSHPSRTSSIVVSLLLSSWEIGTENTRLSIYVSLYKHTNITVSLLQDILVFSSCHMSIRAFPIHTFYLIETIVYDTKYTIQIVSWNPSPNWHFISSINLI